VIVVYRTTTPVASRALPSCKHESSRREMMRHMRPCSKGFVVPEPPENEYPNHIFLQPMLLAISYSLPQTPVLSSIHAARQSFCDDLSPCRSSIASARLSTSTSLPGFFRKINLAEGSTLHDSSTGPKIRNREHNCCIARLFPTAGPLKLASLLLFYADLVQIVSVLVPLPLEE
jgi:hypothetical protein